MMAMNLVKFKKNKKNYLYLKKLFILLFEKNK